MVVGPARETWSSAIINSPSCELLHGTVVKLHWTLWTPSSTPTEDRHGLIAFILLAAEQSFNGIWKKLNEKCILFFLNIYIYILLWSWLQNDFKWATYFASLSMPYPISLPDSKAILDVSKCINRYMYMCILNYCDISTAEFKFIWVAMMDLDRPCVALWKGRRVEVERNCMASHSQSQGFVGPICM